MGRVSCFVGARGELKEHSISKVTFMVCLSDLLRFVGSDYPQVFKDIRFDGIECRPADNIKP